MNWHFWKPRHTVLSVATQLAEGLGDGSIVLDKPFAAEPEEESPGAEELLLQFDVPEGMSDAQVLIWFRSARWLRMKTTATTAATA